MLHPREKILRALKRSGECSLYDLSYIRPVEERNRALDDLVREGLVVEKTVKPQRGKAGRRYSLNKVRAVALLVPCPRCGKRVGECMTKDGDGYSNGYLHAGRVRIAHAIVEVLGP